MHIYRVYNQQEIKYLKLISKVMKHVSDNFHEHLPNIGTLYYKSSLCHFLDHTITETGATFLHDR